MMILRASCPAASRIVALSLSFFVLFSSSTATSSKCFNPSGQETTARACNATADISSCCDEGFACLSNGLCTPGPEYRGQDQFKYYRSGCTDQDWKAESCPQLCLGDSNSTDAPAIQRCPGLGDIPSGFHCCHSGAEDCCTTPSKIFTLPIAQLVGSIPYPANLTAPATAENITASPRKGGIPTIAIGLGVGFGVGVVLAILLSVFIIYRRRRGRVTEIDTEPIIRLRVSEPMKLKGTRGSVRSLESGLAVDGRGYDDAAEQKRYAIVVPDDVEVGSGGNEGNGSARVQVMGRVVVREVGGKEVESSGLGVKF